MTTFYIIGTCFTILDALDAYDFDDKPFMDYEQRIDVITVQLLDIKRRLKENYSNVTTTDDSEYTDYDTPDDTESRSKDDLLTLISLIREIKFNFYYIDIWKCWGILKELKEVLTKLHEINEKFIWQYISDDFDQHINS
jgi:hypothetical protein